MPKAGLIQDEGGRAKATNTLNCSLCKLCIEVCETGAVKIIPILDSFVMTAESSGEMPAKELVASASQEIRKRAVEFEAKLAELS